MDKTAVYLTDDEALLFVQYQKRYAFMKILEDLGAFDLKSGSLTLHFDNLGGIGSVDIQRHIRI